MDQNLKYTLLRQQHLHKYVLIKNAFDNYGPPPERFKKMNILISNQLFSELSYILYNASHN